MMSLATSSKNDVILVRCPFADVSSATVRPAVVVSASHVSQDLLIVPFRTVSRLAGEFVFADRTAAGLNVPTAGKRGLYPVHEALMVKTVGRLSQRDAEQVARSGRDWLGLA